MLLWKFFRFVVTGAFVLWLKIRGIMLILCAVAFAVLVGKLMAIGTKRQATPLSTALSGVLCVFFLVLGFCLPNIRIVDLLFL